jgi:muramoyltetrapeptide carboxypeptidase LdcA involved in peptidoglycan recycling
MDLICPPRLRPGDELRVIAPSLSRPTVTRRVDPAPIEARFAGMGLRISYGRHVDEVDAFGSSPVAARIADLHDAFTDPTVAGVSTVIGGFNSNELLPFVDWNLIRANPKVFCGFSDITALQAAMLARAGMITWSGPHWSTFGMRDHCGQTLDWFQAALLRDAPVELRPSPEWTDDRWFLDQDDRHPERNDGWWPLRAGQATGPIVGGNLCTLNLLQGTGYLPGLDGTVLVIEDDETSDVVTFARNLTSLLQLPDAPGVRGLAIGRFQRASQLSRELLDQIVGNQPALAGKPVLANIDVGHTSPMATVPIGGTAELFVDPGNPGGNRLGLHAG